MAGRFPVWEYDECQVVFGGRPPLVVDTADAPRLGPRGRGAHSAAHPCCTYSRPLLPLTSFRALQEGGRYWINSGQTVPSGLSGVVAIDP
jgi:hypothetical protein